jgi:hypothetical protein
MAEILGERRELGLGAAVDNDVRARLQQAAAHRAADRAHTPDDQRGLASERHLHSEFLIT